MLNTDQKARVEVLLAIEKLNAEEAEELKTLQALEPEDPNQDEFDAGWDELEGKKVTKPLDETDAEQEAQLAKNEEKDAKAKKEAEEAALAKESQSTDSGDTDGDILNTTQADPDKTLDSDGKKIIPDSRDEEIKTLKDAQSAQDQKMRSWDGRIKAAEKRAAEAEQKLKDAEAKGKDGTSEVSPDIDDAELSVFFKEYPDLEGPMKKVAEKLATKIFDSKIGNKIETLEDNQGAAQETAQVEADRIHMAAINTAHSDWQKIYDSGALETWIKRQPEYLQPRLHEILKKGSASDVIGMFDSYKRAAGKGKETTTNSASSEDKKAKAAAIEAVPASTAGAKKGAVKITKDDFDGAWDELEKKDEKQK